LKDVRGINAALEPAIEAVLDHASQPSAVLGEEIAQSLLITLTRSLKKFG
jgi:hypothetical protein